jgi:hypothetical protein
LFFTTHSLERAVERGEILSKVSMKIIFRRIVDKFIEPIYQDVFLKNYETFLAFSKEYNRALIFEFRPDKYSSSEDKHIFMITVLPEGKHLVKPGSSTMKMMLEGTEQSSALLEFFSSFISEQDIQDSYDYAFAKVNIAEHFNLYLVEGQIHASDVNLVVV